ncbi:hypothetical protein FB451DRAFT_1552869 [Mycena latifolia]|nr:hypothetical protein FB451DRAFT_1552869 [Mycena latifolia]
MAQSMSSLISLVLLVPLLVAAAPAAVSSEGKISSAVNSAASIPVPSAPSGIVSSSASVPSGSGVVSEPVPLPISSGVASQSVPVLSGVASAPVGSSVPIQSSARPSGAHPSGVPSAVPSEGSCGHPPRPQSSHIKPSDEPTGLPVLSSTVSKPPKPSFTGTHSTAKEPGTPSIKPSSAPSVIPSGEPSIKPSGASSIGLPASLPVGSAKPSVVASSATAVKSNIASAEPSSASDTLSKSAEGPGQSSVPEPSLPVSSGVAPPSGTPSLPAGPSGTISAPVSAPSGTGTGNFTFDPGCTALSTAEVQSIPGWSKLKAEAEKNWGTQAYNVVTNDKDFTKNVAQKCAGKTPGTQVAKGWVWFQYLQTVQGHFKWALELDAILSDEAQRTLPGGK